MEYSELCEELAKKIYVNVFDCDDKYFRASKCSEIYDWLMEGDQEHVKTATIDALSIEFELYDL